MRSHRPPRMALTPSAASASQGPELIFGLVGALGADLQGLEKILSAVLSDYSYAAETIRLSDLLKELRGFEDLPETFVDERIEAFMAAGTKVREQTGRPDAMAILGVQQIRKLRSAAQGGSGSPGEPISRQGYIFHSLKRPEEIDTLRRIYGPAFFVIGAYSPRDKRRKHLVHRIGGSHHQYPPKPDHNETAERLIKKDEHETDKTVGQNVSEAFPKADVFVDVSENEPAVRAAIDRFIAIIFGYQFHTPTRDENAMFHAHAAGMRSSEMGRQVGASISTSDGEIVALGTNDVPKTGGGLYWPELNGSEDHRDFQRGIDTSDMVKRNNLAEVLTVLAEHKLLAADVSGSAFEDFLTACLPLMKHTRVMNSIEFGRAVHAEMDAITGASRRGARIKGCTLYTTTFPCHTCTRHIVASGLLRVVFIEPYAKSLASDLHDDSISVEGLSPTGGRVLFVPFVGIAPHRYLHLFQMEKRKSDGNKIPWEKTRAQPRIFPPTLGYTEHEVDVSSSFLTALQLSGFVSESLSKEKTSGEKMA